MKSIVSAALCTATLFTPPIALADLGAADSGERRELSGRSHEAWCGTKSNTNCRVKFQDGRMTVDGGSGITASQIKQVIHSEKFFADHAGYRKGGKCEWLGLGPKHCHEHFEFQYVADDGTTRWATIRFMNRQAAGGFQADVEAWIGQPLRSIGPSVKLEL